MKRNNILSAVLSILIYLVIYLGITQTFDLNIFVLAVLPPFIFTGAVYLNNLFWNKVWHRDGYFEYLPVGMAVWVLTDLIVLL